MSVPDATPRTPSGVIDSMMRTALLAACALCPVLAIGASPSAPSAAVSTPAPPVVAGPAVGQPAPDFALATLDGRVVHLHDFRGKTLVINVWGSWCPPCRLETPDLIAEFDSGKSRGVAFLGVDTTETATAVRAFVAEKAIAYPQAVTDGESRFARDYDIRNYPTTFVIDPGGVLRARHADNLLPRTQLHAYIVAAERGQSAPLVSALQTQLDALLDPARYPLTGNVATVRANVALIVGAIARANDAMDGAMADGAQDHDLVATQANEERLRSAAIAALTPIAAGDADLLMLARLRGDEAVAQGRWNDADAAYALALRYAPNDLDVLSGQSYAREQLGDHARVEAISARIAELSPSAPTLVALGRVQGKRGELAAAEASFSQALTLAVTPIATAWTNLYFGRVEAAAGRTPQAKAAFARALAAATAIPASNPRSAWYIEQAQEGAIALGVTPGAPPALSLAPWTGADLPGSIASTIKYRLAVTGARGKTIALRVRGLPAHWIGSFCTDRVCAPFATTIVLPSDGVKIVEFQVVPIGRATARRPATIDASVGTVRVASATVPT